MGQIIRVSAAMHVLFHLDNTDPLPDVITDSAIKAAIDFVEVCCQHTAYITGHGKIDEELEILKSDNKTTGDWAKTSNVYSYIIKSRLWSSEMGENKDPYNSAIG